MAPRPAAIVLTLWVTSCHRGEAARRAVDAAATGAVVVPNPSAASTPCGALECAQYDSPRDAFRAVLAAGPRVLGIGEAHAPRGARVPSAAKRFTDELLPLLAGRASDLIVELMMPPAGCRDAAAAVRKEEEPVTSRQAKSDQGEYVAMGERARSLGIVPDMLRPTCTDLDALRAAGDADGGGAIDASLTLIARLIATQAEHLVDRDARSETDRGKWVVLYGGMLHNRLSPPREHAAWSYGPALDAYVDGHLVTVDLIVPELIGENEAWRELPWRAAYDRARLGGKTTLFRTGDHSYVLVFPETRTPSADGGSR